MVATIQLPLSNALDMQQRDVLNSTNLISEWQAGDHITTYGTEGTVVYTDGDPFRLWRRNSTPFDPATDSQESPDTAVGATYWTEIEVSGGGAGQVGFSLEQLGTMTAEALPADEARNYRWFSDATSFNGSGLNNWGYDVTSIVTPYRAPGTDPLDQTQLADLYNAGAILTNATGEVQTIVTVDLDVSILRTGTDGNATLELSFVHRVPDRNNPGSFVYNHITTSIQTFGSTGFRTFEYAPRGVFEVGVGETISITLTALTANQMVNVTGVRFSSTSASWLNPVYPALGSSPLENWVINGTPDVRAPILRWDPAAGLNEWMPNQPYAVGDRFFTSTRPDFFPDPSTRGNIYEVIAAYFSDDTLDVRNVDNTIQLVESTNAEALRWSPDGPTGIPPWNAAVTYEIGDVIAYKFAAGSILSTPVMIPPVATTSILRYTGAATGGTGPSEEPLIIGNALITGFNRSSRDWAIETGSIATFNGATSFSFGSYAVYERQLFRALTDNIRPDGAQLPAPTIGANWELEADAAILHWRPNTMFYEGNIVFRTGTVSGGIYIVDADFTTGPTFSTTGLTPFPLLDTEWAGKAFAAGGFYEVGDVVSQTDSNNIEQLWVLTGTPLSGLAVPIDAADQPGGSNDHWQLIEIQRGREVVDTWQPDIDYDPGDVVTLLVNTGDIRNTGNPTTSVPPNTMVMHFQYLGGGTAGSGTEEPVTEPVTPPGGNGIVSRQWAIAGGTTIPFLDVQNSGSLLQYAAGSYVTNGGHIYRAVSNVLRATDADRVDAPTSASALWEQESTSLPTTVPALAFEAGASEEFTYASGTNRFEVLGINALGTPLYFDVNSSGSGNVEFVDVIPHDANLRPAWDAFASTSSLAIQTGTFNYPDPTSSANQVTVAHPTIDGSPIVTQEDLDPQLDLTGRDITPGSVQVGGDLGAFIWRPETDGITRGAALGQGVVTGTSVSYVEDTITIPPIGNLALDTAYILEITESDVTGLPIGDYIAQAIFTPDADGNPTGDVVFRGLRLVTNGIARNPIADLPSDTSTGIALTVHQFTSTVGLLDLVDVATDQYVLSASAATDVVDFAQIPTVNGRPLIEEYTTSSNIPPLASNLVIGEIYILRVTNHSPTDLPDATRLTIGPLVIPADELDIGRGVLSGNTAYFRWTPDLATVEQLQANPGTATLEPVLRFGTGAGAINLNILDDVSSAGSVIHYDFNSFTALDDRRPGFMVTPSDTGVAIPVRTDYHVEIECDIPANPLDLVVDQLYTFNVYIQDFDSVDLARDMQFGDFRLLSPYVEGASTQLSPINADAAGPNNPTTITPRSAHMFQVSWDQASIDSIQAYAAADPTAANFQDLTRPAVNIPGLGVYLANHSGNVSRSGSLTDRANGNIATWTDNGTALTGDNFTDLLSLHFILVDSDIPLTAAGLVPLRPYVFRVYTRDVSYTPDATATPPLPNLSADNFPIRIDAGQAVPDIYNGPTSLAPNTVTTFTVAWNETSVQSLRNGSSSVNEVLRPTFDAEGVGEFIAVHDAILDTGQILDNQSEIQSADRRIDQLENRIVALQNEVHNLEEGGTGERLDTNEFRTATVSDPSIDELVSYLPSGGLTQQWALNTTNDQTVMVQRGSFSLPYAIRLALDNHLANIYSSLRGFDTTYTRTIAGGGNQVLPFGGERLTRHAVVTLSYNDGTVGGTVETISIPVEITQSGQGDQLHRMIYPWPIDATFTYTDLNARWFINDPFTQSAISSIELSNTAAGILEVPLTPADHAELLGAAGDIIVARYTDISGQAEERLVNVTDSRNDSPFVGFQYANLSVAGVTDPIHTQIGSEIFIALGSLAGTGSSHVVANDVPTTDNLTSLRVDDVVYNTLPLYTRKSDLFMGIEVATGIIRLFVAPASGGTVTQPMNLTWTEYVTQSISYYFLEGVQTPDFSLDTPDRLWRTGDGIWTTVDIRDYDEAQEPALIGQLTAENSANLIG